MEDGAQRSTASLSTGRAERALKGLRRFDPGGMRGQPFVRTISTLPAHILWASAMNKGVVAAPPRTHFGSVPHHSDQSGSGSSRTGGKEHGEVVVEPAGGRGSSQHWPQQGLRANAARAVAIREDRRIAAYPTRSTRRLHRGSHRGTAMTSRRGRGEDSVYLD